MAEIRRSHGTRALAALLPKLAEPAMRKRGFTQAALLARWADIVGPSLARDAMPDRLAFARGSNSGGTLHVRVAGSAAVELQHLAPQITERINGFFGYPAVARIALVQGPVESRPVRPTPVPPRPVPPARATEIESAVSGIDDDRLRDALAALGRAVAAGPGR